MQLQICSVYVPELRQLVVSRQNYLIIMDSLLFGPLGRIVLAYVELADTFFSQAIKIAL